MRSALLQQIFGRSLSTVSRLKGWTKVGARMLRSTHRLEQIASRLVIGALGASLNACAHDEAPVAPSRPSLSSQVSSRSAEAYARFDADIITAIYLDSTRLIGRVSDAAQDSGQRRAIRTASQRPLVAAYHLTYVDSGGTTSILLTAPSADITQRDAPPTFLDWRKIASIRLTAGESPVISLRDGRTIAAEVPALSTVASPQTVNASAISGRRRSPVVRDTQLRGMLAQYLRRAPSTAEARRDAFARDSVRKSSGFTRRWESLTPDVDVATHRELLPPAERGGAMRRVVIDIRNPIAVGAVSRLVVEE
jgi:hypothetical protein